jgi:hypothetical protein
MIALRASEVKLPARYSPGRYPSQQPQAVRPKPRSLVWGRRIARSGDKVRWARARSNSKKGLPVKRSEDAVSVPGGATSALRRLSVSGREAAALAAVVTALVPLLMLEGGVLSLPSLLERGVESLMPRLADGKPHLQPAVAPSRLDTLAGVTLGAGVVATARNERAASRGGVSVAPDESHRVTGSRGSRAVSVSAREVPQGPAPGVAVPSPPAAGSPPVAAGPGGSGDSGPGGGPGAGGGRGPGEPVTPTVMVGVNGTTATVSVDTGPATATASATVSGSTSGASVAGSVAGVPIAADAGQVAEPGVTARAGSVAVSVAAALAPS